MINALETAAQHDAAGRFEDAVNALAVATRNGDVGAMTALGKRLIIGDRAPYLPADGARLLSDAAKANDPSAALTLACMSALGSHVPQSWETAFALLIHAATLGSESARAQLRILAGHTAESGGDDWVALARSVRLADWISPVEGQDLNAEPLIRHYPGFVGAAACDWLMRHVRQFLQPAKIFSGDEGRHITDDMRTNSIGPMSLASIDMINVIVQYRIAAVTGLSIDNFDGPTALHYAVGEEIKDHHDFINPTIPNYQQEIETRGERLVTFLVYLNGDYEGGETAFPKLNVSHKGSAGDGLLFVNTDAHGKPDVRSVHAGRPPIHGEKWLISQFVRQRAVFNTPAETLY
jgi:prolyl 4-hydroxylase